MKKEYAVQAASHWSDAYPTLSAARTAGKDLGIPYKVLRLLQRAPGHEYGAQWKVVEEGPKNGLKN